MDNKKEKNIKRIVIIILILLLLLLLFLIIISKKYGLDLQSEDIVTREIDTVQQEDNEQDSNYESSESIAAEDFDIESIFIQDEEVDEDSLIEDSENIINDIIITYPIYIPEISNNRPPFADNRQTTIGSGVMTEIDNKKETEDNKQKIVDNKEELKDEKEVANNNEEQTDNNEEILDNEDEPIILSNNTKIGELQINGELITATDNNTYKYKTSKGIKSLSFSIILEDENAKVTALNTEESSISVSNDEIILNSSEELMTITFLVTAEDGTIEEYILEIMQLSNIIGRILTENIFDNHIADITVYESYIDDEPIFSIATNDNGIFDIDLLEGIYHIVITKPGYLKHTIIEIEINAGEIVDLGEIIIIAGDVNSDGVIGLEDLSLISSRNGAKIGTSKYNEKYDFNGDEIIDVLDRDILRANYDKTAVMEKWSKSPSADDDVIE